LTFSRKNSIFSHRKNAQNSKEFKGMNKNVLFFAVLVVLLTTLLTEADAQLYERKIIEYVKMISAGQGKQVAIKLPDLKKKIPRSAGLIYVEGLIATKGDEAIKCFKIIADSFPHSEWADDAIARLFEYHQSVGDPKDGERNYERLKNEYPTSPYLTTNYLREVRFSQDRLPQNQENDYAVQIGAFTIRENAEKLRQRFITEGYKVDIYENLLDGKTLLYLVWVGSFVTEEEAEQLRSEIKTKYNIDGLIRIRSSWKKW
jgi:hypothetical protein